MASDGPEVTTGAPDYTRLEFPAPPPNRPYIIANMVMSADGKVVVEGTEQGLGSDTDQRLMRELRTHADVVLNGAGTLRASGTSSRVPEQLQQLRVERGKTPNPIAAVLSATAILPLDKAFFTAGDFEAVVYVSDGADASKVEALRGTGRTVVVVPAEGYMRAMLLHMREVLGARLLLVEGGPATNGQLFDAGDVDEFFLSLGSVVVAGNGTLTPVRSDRDGSLALLSQLELVSTAVNPETSELYLRYRVGDRGPR